MPASTRSAPCPWWPLVVVAVIALVAPVARAQEARETALKAAFIYNFARFTVWPADVLPAARPLTICVADVRVAGALEQIVDGRTIHQRPVVVVRPVNREALRSCHMLYAGDLDGKASADLLALLGDAPVFSIADSEAFVLTGGVARFFVQRGRLQFAINVAAAQRARLRLSSRLLRLATIVKEPHRGR